MKQIVLKRSLLTVWVVLVFSLFGASAQDKKEYNPTDVLGFQAQVMKEYLDLTEEQFNKLVDIHMKDSVRTKNMSTEEANEVRKEREAKYKEILSEKQYKKWLEKKDEINDEAQFRYLTSDAYAKEFEKVISKDN